MSYPNIKDLAGFLIIAIHDLNPIKQVFLFKIPSVVRTQGGPRITFERNFPLDATNPKSDWAFSYRMADKLSMHALGKCTQALHDLVAEHIQRDNETVRRVRIVTTSDRFIIIL